MFEQLESGFWQEINLGSTLGWGFMIVIAVLGAFLIKIVLKFIETRFRKIAFHFRGVSDDVLITCIAGTKSWSIFIWILQALIQSSEAPRPGKQAVFIAFVVLSALQVVIWGLRSIAIWKTQYLSKKMGQDASAASAVGLMTTALQGLFIAAIVLMCLSNLGVNITALITGMGIGGIAVALAAQNILGDLFGSLSIVLDKPFVVGDFIVTGNDMGTVETIGIKTTRVRSLSGEELIFANKDLLESRVKNFKRMRERRAVLNFDLSYATPVEKLKQVPGWIENFVKEEDLLRFERCHLANLNETSLRYELIFWVTDPDQTKYMDRQQSLIYKILKRFEDEEITFALGSRALIVRRENLLEQSDLDKNSTTEQEASH
jgi:small-conductance mechanosensitive channel